MADGSQPRMRVRAAWRSLARLSGVATLLLAALLAQPCAAQPVKGEASFTTAGGYGRLVLRLAEDVESDVAMAGMIVVIRFKRPVDIPVDKLADSAADYLGSARRDPDGMAIRLALSRKATVNAMSAGERLYVDLLPDGWAGLPPPLPQEVVRELSERARAAERALRLARSSAELKKRPPVRVRASVQPTFVRYVFETPDNVGVSSTLSEQKLSIMFNVPLTFDLADAKLVAPPNIASIGQKVEGNSSSVDVALIGNVDVHSFREDKNYVVDIGFQQPDGPSLPKTGPLAALLPYAAKNGKPAAAAAAPRPAEEIAQPTSESIAQQANLKKPEPAKDVAAKPEPKAEVQPEANKTEAKAEPVMEPAKAEPAPKAEAKPEAKVEPKVEPRVEAQVEPKPELTADAKAEPATPAVKVATEPDTKPAAAEPPKPAAAAEGRATPVEARRSSDGLRLTFNFAAPSPAALFRRGDITWLVLDSKAPFDLEPIRREGSSVVGDVSRMLLPNGQAIRIRLGRPQLASLREDDGGKSWSVLFSDSGQNTSPPLTAVRNISDPARATVTVALAKLGLTHRLVDPDAGDALTVVTALPPPRGFIKRQDFVEFSLLESIHGVVIQLNSDDVTVDSMPDAVVLGRPGGLTLSSADANAQNGNAAARPFFDPGQWSKDQEGSFKERLDALTAAASLASGAQRLPARLDLARFYMARAMYPEAKGVLDLALSDTKPGQEDAASMIGHAAASALMGRPEQTLKDIANPAISSSYDAQLWKAMAMARQGKWAEAREKLKSVEFAINALPLDIQRVVFATAMRASLEVKDYSGAAARSTDLDQVGVPPEMVPALTVMRGRLDEALGRDQDALVKYQEMMTSPNREAASDAALRDIVLRQKRGDLSAADALPELERLTITWRGDEQEVKTQLMLSRLYAAAGRYADSLAAAKTATGLQPNSESARQAQDESRALFTQLFLGPKGDEMPPIEALGTFYEFRELTPVGRRGDEMIRRLADRLVAVDLLDQAAELLQYQVDKRLEGAARSQVAAKLAMIYLMNRKPDRAIAALRTSRIADLAGEVRQQRLLLEARAQSDIGRHDLALDIISNSGGREAIRLRSDIYWASRRWREASEQVELYLGERWRDFRPLSAGEKSDVIRAAVGYALAEDSLGLARFREKFAPLMADTADRTAFDTASRPAAGNSAEFAAIAKMAASVDTLDGFLREMRARFPDASARVTQPADPTTTGSLPAIVGVRQIPLTKASSK